MILMMKTSISNNRIYRDWIRSDEVKYFQFEGLNQKLKKNILKRSKLE